MMNTMAAANFPIQHKSLSVEMAPGYVGQGS